MSYLPNVISSNYPAKCANEMKRRAVFTNLLGRNMDIDESITLVSGLAPYSGLFDLDAANHLLRRTGFGVDREHLLTAVEEGLAITLDKVFSDPPLPEEPLNSHNENDPNVPIGESWVEQPYTPGLQVGQGMVRKGSLTGWTLSLCADPSHISVREKMVLFWHNHFPVADINDPKFLYKYSTTLRAHALGNFRALTKEITIDPAMLRYLNGNQNEASSPNENFARELLELFTVGKGDLAGPGDYTNYTEDDIKEMAKVLTGWKDFGWFSFNETQPHSDFDTEKHDTSTKILSNRFGGLSIADEGEEEFKTLIDIIFQQDATAKYICSKLYRWFLNSNIDQEEAQQVIEEMAVILINSDYEILPVLQALFASEHFFNDCNRGSLIKNPLDFTCSMLKGLSNKFVEDLKGRYQQYSMINFSMALAEMIYYNPPSVAGWKAYYQEPLLDRSWLNSVTISYRIQLSVLMMADGISIFNAEALKPDPLLLINSLETPRFVNEMIEQITQFFFPQPLSSGQKNYLKEALLGLQQDSVWESEYILYSDNPQDEVLANSIRNRLKSMFARLFSMAEFQLM